MDDLRITVYTAEPGTDNAERLALVLVLGTQALVDQIGTRQHRVGIRITGQDASAGW